MTQINVRQQITSTYKTKDSETVKVSQFSVDVDSEVDVSDDTKVRVLLKELIFGRNVVISAPKGSAYPFQAENVDVLANGRKIGRGRGLKNGGPIYGHALDLNSLPFPGEAGIVVEIVAAEPPKQDEKKDGGSW